MHWPGVVPGIARDGSDPDVIDEDSAIVVCHDMETDGKSPVDKTRVA